MVVRIGTEPHLPPRVSPLRFGAQMSSAELVRVESRLIFEGCKWDPQVGDVRTLFPAPLLLNQNAWEELARLAVMLQVELEQAEDAVLSNPDLIEKLALPRGLVDALRRGAASCLAPAAFRCTRFDFHWTEEGWRISEANTDVPGGFIEASTLPALVATNKPGLHPPPDPISGLVDAIRRRFIAPRCHIALIHATAYVDDRQVMVAIQHALRTAGYQSHLAAPDQICWSLGNATLHTGWYAGPVDLIIRFFPAEWLPNLPFHSGWSFYFAQARTPQVNPGRAILSQSKRLPLVWDQINPPMSTWRSLLPRCAEPSDVLRRGTIPDDWVVKPALGRVGEGVGIEGVTERSQQKRILKEVRRNSTSWIAQRRFRSLAIDSPHGPAHVSLGVYVIDGQPYGVYARVAPQPLIDASATEAPLLLEPESTSSISHRFRNPLEAITHV